MFWNDKRIVEKTPVLTVLLLESANLQQIWRIWSERSAEGQSLGGWACVNCALLLWLNFYRVVTPEAKWAFYATAAGVLVNSLLIMSVAAFRYVL